MTRPVFTALVERDVATGLLVGSLPGMPGAHTRGVTIEEVRQNLAQVLRMLQSEGALEPESEFVATIEVVV